MKLPMYLKNLVLKQSAAPMLTSLAGAATGLWLRSKYTLIMWEPLSGCSWTSKVFNIVIILDTYQSVILKWFVLFFFAVFPDSQKFSNSNKSCCFGYCIDLLRQLAQQCNFTYSLHLSFNEYGSLERNNQTGKQEWNGLIGKIKALERLLGWI